MDCIEWAKELLPVAFEWLGGGSCRMNTIGVPR
jgi:hypothetical protein